MVHRYIKYKTHRRRYVDIDTHFYFNSICQSLFRAIVTHYCLNINDKIHCHLKTQEALLDTRGF